jgi:MSHA pilin protein MshD
MMAAAFKRVSGFSLMEMVLTIAIISVSLVVLITAFGGLAKRTADPVLQAKAAFLGQAYMDEIITKRFDEQSPIGGTPACDASSCSATLGPDALPSGATESRTDYDDVDDYTGLIETPSLNALGAARPEYDGFQIAVQVRYAGGDFGRPSHTLKRIEVTVTPPGENGIRFTAYRGNY